MIINASLKTIGQSQFCHLYKKIFEKIVADSVIDFHEDHDIIIFTFGFQRQQPTSGGTIMTTFRSYQQKKEVIQIVVNNFPSKPFLSVFSQNWSVCYGSADSLLNEAAQTLGRLTTKTTPPAIR